MLRVLPDQESRGNVTYCWLLSTTGLCNGPVLQIRKRWFDLFKVSRQERESKPRSAGFKGRVLILMLYFTIIPGLLGALGVIRILWKVRSRTRSKWCIWFQRGFSTQECLSYCLSVNLFFAPHKSRSSICSHCVSSIYFLGNYIRKKHILIYK